MFPLCFIAGCWRLRARFNIRAAARKIGKIVFLFEQLAWLGLINKTQRGKRASLSDISNLLMSPSNELQDFLERGPSSLALATLSSALCCLAGVDADQGGSSCFQHIPEELDRLGATVTFMTSNTRRSHSQFNYHFREIHLINIV